MSDKAGRRPISRLGATYGGTLVLRMRELVHRHQESTVLLLFKSIQLEEDRYT